MPRQKKNKTKKTTRIKKTLKKITSRKKTAPKSSSRKATKTMKNTRARRLSSKKPSSKKRVVRKTTTPKKTIKKSASKSVRSRVSRTVKKAAPKSSSHKAKKTVKNTPVVKSKAKIPSPDIPVSPHVLDLRSVAKQKQVEQAYSNENQNDFAEQLFSKLSNSKQALIQRSKSAYSDLKNTASTQKPKMHIPEDPEQEPETFSSQSSQQPHTIFSQKKIPRIKRIAFKGYLQRIELPKVTIPRFPVPSWMPKSHLHTPVNWKRAIIAFVIFSFAFTLPFNVFSYYQKMQDKKQLILQSTQQVADQVSLIQDAFANNDIQSAQNGLKAAHQSLSFAHEQLTDIGIFMENLIKITPKINKEYSAVEHILEIGTLLTQSGSYITEQIRHIQLYPDKHLTNNINAVKQSFEYVIPDLELASEKAQDIDVEAMPQEYQAHTNKIKTSIPFIEKTIKTAIDSADALLTILGHEHTQRYLLIFQNNNELRPTGGFMGSFALVDIDRGNLKKIDIPPGGPYDLKAGLEVELKAPTPLRIVTDRWEFQDANYYPDFPTSAEKIIWFYEKSGGTTVDGVIAINASLLENMLDIIGPIEMPDYGKTITSSNFFNEVQAAVEFEYDKELNNPKQIIADLTPIVLQRLFESDKEQVLDLIALLMDSFMEKELQLFFRNKEVQETVMKHNWGGHMHNTEGDYLSVITTNIAGGKTDAVITQKALLDSTIETDGSISNTLTITQTHTGNPTDRFYSIPHVDYMRIYVPNGSTLIDAQGFNPPDESQFQLKNELAYAYDDDEFLTHLHSNAMMHNESQTEVYTAFNKTVFANWIIVGPGETKKVTITYTLPFNIFSKSQTQDKSIFSDWFDKDKDNMLTHNLFIQKQSGKRNFTVLTTVNVPETLSILWAYPDANASTDSGVSYMRELNTDAYMGLLLEHNTQ